MDQVFVCFCALGILGSGLGFVLSRDYRASCTLKDLGFQD